MSTGQPRIEIVRACPGIGFSMTGQALDAVGRTDILFDLPTRESITDAKRPVLVIPAGGTWNFLPSGDLPGAVGMLRRARETLGTFDGLTIAFDCAGEGFLFYPDVHAQVAAEMAQHGLDATRCYLLTSRLDGQGYMRCCERQGQAPLFQPLYSPVQLYFFAGRYRAAHDLTGLTQLIEERSPAFSGIRPRKYVCLNFMPRDNRWAIVLTLMKEGVMDEGFVSFYGRSPEVAGYEGHVDLELLKRDLRQLRLPEALIDRVDELDGIAPIELDEAPSNRFTKAYAVADQAYYAQSYFSIVTESDFTGRAGYRFTEKVLKPIANLQPFVALATPGVLAELRRLGFQTFSPLIDESYDEMEDASERLHAGIEAALKLVRMSPTQLHDLYSELWPRLVHNYLHFLCGTPRLVDQDSAFLALSSPS